MGYGEGGVRDFLATKPPSAVFLLCLLSFAFATMSLFIYFSRVKQVSNPDALDWNRFLLESGNLHFCLDSSRSKRIMPTNRSSVSVGVAVMPEWVGEYHDKVKDYVIQSKTNVVTIRSHVKMSEMGRSVPYKYRKQDAVLTFQIPLNSDGKGSFACIGVEASSDLLELMNSGLELPQNCSLPSGETTANVESISGDHVPPSWCKTGMVFKLKFGTHPAWSVFIYPHDQVLIQLHLMVTSVFLFVLVGVILTAIFIHGRFFKR